MPTDHQISGFIQVPLFLAMFVFLWIAVCAILAALSGWFSLARQFRSAAPAQGTQFSLVSGTMGTDLVPGNFTNCFYVTVNDAGFELSILFIFRFWCPPLFFPWSSVASVETSRGFFQNRTAIRIHEQWSIITIRGDAGKRIEEAFVRYQAGAEKR